MSQGENGFEDMLHAFLLEGVQELSCLVYGTSYKESSQDNLKKKLAATASKRSMYGFSLPGDAVAGADAEELTLALLAKGFCDKTTSHGVAHLYQASSHGKKVFWAVLSLLALGALVFHMIELVSAYMKFDKSTDVRVNNSIRQLNFPAVTICNNNMIRTSKIGVSLNNLVSDASNKEDRATARQEIGNTIAYEYSLMTDLDLKWELGHQFENMTIFAKYAYQDAYDEFVHIFNPWHGNCYTYNHHSATNRVQSTRAGPANGLWMFINIEQYEYIPFLTEASGLKVLVHDPGTTPFPEDGGITVPPNTLTNLAIKKTEFQRINGRFGDCLKPNDDQPSTIYGFEYGYSYSKPACERSCLQEQVILQCGCFVPEIPYNSTFFGKTVEPCESQGQQSVCMAEGWSQFSAGDIPCDECRQPCDQDLYEVSVSSTTWPSPTYMPDLKREVEDERPVLFETLTSHYELADTIALPIKENFLQLQIFYETLSVTQISESPSVTDFQFISDFGGALGLWVGWSMLTIFEFFEYTVDILVFCCVKYKSNKKSRKTHPNSQRITVQETSMHQT
ncbi:amiloride-sensitive sodium channel subunit alpha-like [Watersipora subatra]|uniref:amiloride-sensitive sodium channel subunit alpha-like n=1 Tax=Watersipora subatra TaxID=2589382 RepID=UPI00355BDD52